MVPREIEDNTYLKVEGVGEGRGGGGLDLANKVYRGNVQQMNFFAQFL